MQNKNTIIQNAAATSIREEPVDQWSNGSYDSLEVVVHNWEYHCFTSVRDTGGDGSRFSSLLVRASITRVPMRP
jgi:hypothetical protein